ncbi:MAG TPA: outer membrane beta-barrel protein [Bryobacteraceae bacterium]|nr:outer membrane beta-barrel protein [Bryobacteraceae bacterium]
MNKLALVLLPIFSAISLAQTVSVGVLGGVPLIDQTYNHDESRPYVIGPSIEVRLLAGFALEADALYQRLGNSFSYQLLDSTGVVSGPGPASFANRLRANMWEFPLLGKYYFRRDSAWQPFIGTGWALRFANINQAGTETSIDANGAPNTFAFRDSFRSDLEVGATVAAGVRYRIGHFAILPEVRYTRWGGSNGTFRKNEAALFLGISF